MGDYKWTGSTIVQKTENYHLVANILFLWVPTIIFVLACGLFAIPVGSINLLQGIGYQH
jgi:hypothetical protein